MVLMVPLVVRVKTRISQAGSKGFTLVELLIVLSLIVIFSSIVLLNVGGLYEKFILKENTLNIVRFINRARTVAMAERVPVVLRINTGVNSISLYSQKKGEINRLRISEGLTLEGNEVEFSPLGDNTGGTLKITDRKGRFYLIVIDRAISKVRIEKSH